jgi:hypothetical protein
VCPTPPLPQRSRLCTSRMGASHHLLAASRRPRRRPPPPPPAGRRRAPRRAAPPRGAARPPGAAPPRCSAAARSGTRAPSRAGPPPCPRRPPAQPFQAAQRPPGTPLIVRATTAISGIRAETARPVLPTALLTHQDASGLAIRIGYQDWLSLRGACAGRTAADGGAPSSAACGRWSITRAAHRHPQQLSSHTHQATPRIADDAACARALSPSLCMLSVMPDRWMPMGSTVSASQRASQHTPLGARRAPSHGAPAGPWPPLCQPPPRAGSQS